MKRTIRKYIKRISLKNLILPGIILVIVICVFVFLPFEDVSDPVYVSSAEEIFEAYENGEEFISYDISNMTYTGYDYYDGAETAAAFYCAFSEDEESCVFFLIPEDETAGTGTAKIVEKEEYKNVFCANYAKDLGLSEVALEQISGGFVVSGYDYHYWAYKVCEILLAAIMAVCVIYMIINILIFFFPQIHSSCRRLKKYGLSSRDFSDIDRELAEECIVEAGNMFATSHYLVVFGSSTIYMIPLLNVVWAYSYVSRQIFVSRRLLTYTFVVYTSPGGRIIMRGNRKKNTDQILSFLERDFSHIAIGYSEERHKQIKEMFKKGEL